MAYDLSEPLTTEQFSDALWKGLGRTVLFVQRYGDARFRDAIIHGCICDLRFDRQTMDDHCNQLFDIIAASGFADWYVDHLAQVIPSLDPEQTDPWQAVGVLRRFAERGNTTARDAVIEAFDRDAAAGSISYLDDLLLIEGTGGLIRAANHVAWDTIAEDDRWRIWGAVSDLECRDSKETVRCAIRLLRGTHTTLTVWLDYLESEWREVEERRNSVRRSRSIPTYEEFIAFLDNRVQRGRESVVAYAFASMRRVNEETVDRLALDLLNETDPLRELALAGAASNMRPNLVAKLMVRNARPGDEPFLLELACRNLEPDLYHWTAMGIRHVLEAHREIEPRRIGLELYERDACSMCRSGVVELLLKAGPLPDWMLAELPFDSERGIRELVAPA